MAVKQHTTFADEGDSRRDERQECKKSELRHLDDFRLLSEVLWTIQRWREL
jgi:hypothetical protein